MSIKMNEKKVGSLVSIKHALTLFITILSLVSCTIGPNLYNQTEGNVADVTLRAKEARKISDCYGRKTPALVVNQGLYVDKTPIRLSSAPPWLRNHIIIRGDLLPFSYYARTILAGGGPNLLTRYQVGLDQGVLVSLNYSGTVKGALDLLASKAGYVYSVNNTHVYWQAFVTKTFDIAFMPGSSDYLMGKASGGGGAASASTGGSNVVNAILDDSAAAQYSSLKGTLSIWKDLEESIKQMLTPEGRVMVSESTTTVTVRDRPTNMDLISKYICNINHNISKQVLIKVQVLEVTLLADYAYGIDWNVVQNAFSNGKYILNANFGVPVSITTLGQNTSLSTYGIQKGSGNGVGALILALTQQGKVSIVTEPRVVALNNQVSALRILQQNGYLASVQNTTPGGSTVSGSVTSQITPGTLITGFTLYVLPKIMGRKVFLQVNADFSTNQGFSVISSTTGTTPTGTNTSPSIQLPNVTQKQFNQRSVIGSGDTLILAGFRQVQNTANAMQLFDSTALGGQGALQNNSETIILITPIILHGII